MVAKSEGAFVGAYIREYALNFDELKCTTKLAQTWTMCNCAYNMYLLNSVECCVQEFK